MSQVRIIPQGNFRTYTVKEHIRVSTLINLDADAENFVPTLV